MVEAQHLNVGSAFETQVTVTPGQSYILTYWAKQNIPAACQVYLNFGNLVVQGESGVWDTPGATYSSYTRAINATMTSGSAKKSLRLRYNCNGVLGTADNLVKLWFDDVTMFSVV